MVVETQYFTFSDDGGAFPLECGRYLLPVIIAYETYGTLNSSRDNAILIAHGFTADAHAAGESASGIVGWWDEMIGPGKAFDTDKFFVISSNVLGGCAGSTGPSSIDPATGQPSGANFPVVTIRDMVAAQYALVCALGVKSLASISGASMGGQQALQWIVDHPDFVRSAIPIACSARLSAMGLAISDLCRRAILEDPDWNNGNYYGRSTPKGGLAVARMMAHLTYISAAFLDVEFGRRPWINDNYVYKYELGSEFAVQHYLQDEGERFITRFDANSFLYLSQAIEYFDLTRGKRSLAAAFERVRSSVLLISFRTDWLFPVAHLRELETALREARVDVNHITVETSFGHDAFLTDWRKISPLVSEFLSTINTVALP